MVLRNSARRKLAPDCRRIAVNGSGGGCYAGSTNRVDALRRRLVRRQSGTGRAGLLFPLKIAGKDVEGKSMGMAGDAAAKLRDVLPPNVVVRLVKTPPCVV